MSFATKGMTRGSSSSLRQTQTTPNSYFSNTGVLDYKPGVSFGAPMPSHFDTATDSKYSLTLDKTGHTVNMHISGAIDNTQLRTNCDTDNCSELRQDTRAPARNMEMSELAAKISREMMAEAQTTRKTDKVESNKSNTRTDATGSSDIIADLQIGLEHHTGVLQRTQASIQALQNDIQSIQTNITDQANTNAVMDSGLNNHKLALLQQRSAFDTINGSVQEMHAGLNNHKTAILQQKNAVDTINESVEELHTGVTNHQYEIREIKQQQQANHGKALQAKVDGMHNGLVSHAQAITSIQTQMNKFNVDTSPIPRVSTNVETARLGSMLSSHKTRQ